MKKNSFNFDKYSKVKDHPLILGKQIYDELDSERDIDSLIRKVQKKRRSKNNVIDEARIIRALSMLYCLNKINYYKGFVEKNDNK